MAAQSSDIDAVNTSVINSNVYPKSISGRYIGIAITDTIASRKQINKQRQTIQASSSKTKGFIIVYDGFSLYVHVTR